MISSKKTSVKGDETLQPDDMYDLSQYNDTQLFQLMDLDHPTDRELEAKIHQLLQKYQDSDHPLGRKMYSFFDDIYHHFFDVEDEDQEGDGQDTEGPVEGFAVQGTSPEAPQLATSGTWNNNELDILTKRQTTTGTAVTAPPSQKQGVALDQQNTIGFDQNYQGDIKTSKVGYQKSLDYTKGTLNPILKETISRVISIDSQFRDVSVHPYSTDFTFNLSETLQDVVSLKLYSVQIPFTWYTINTNYGSNFVYLKGNSPGIRETGEFDMKIEVPSGNYQSAQLANAMSNSMKKLRTTYTDICFGTSDLIFDQINTRATFILDITQIYNESCYNLQFPPVNLPQITQNYIRFDYPLVVYFKCNADQYVKNFNDLSFVIPIPPQDSYIDTSNETVKSYGYNADEMVHTIQTQFNTSIQPQFNQLSKSSLVNNHVFSGTVVDNHTIDSSNLTMKVNIKYIIPSRYYDKETSIMKPNFLIRFYGDAFTHTGGDKIPILDISFTSDVSSYQINPSGLLIIDQVANPIGMKIYSIGTGNNTVPVVDIPIIFTPEYISQNSTVTGSDTSKFSITITNFFNYVNNFFNKTDISYNISLTGTKFILNNDSTCTFYISCSATLNKNNYSVYFYDPYGYPQTNDNKQWQTYQNAWYNYLHIRDPSYSLSSDNIIKSDASFVNINDSSTNKLSYPKTVNSIQDFFGFTNSTYEIDSIFSNTFLGSQYNSVNNYPNIEISSNFIGEGAIPIVVHLYKAPVMYSQTVNQTEYTKTTDYKDGNVEYDASYVINYYPKIKDNNDNTLRYSFYEIITTVNESIKRNSIFTTESGIHIVDASTNTDVSINPILPFNNGKYKYKFTIKFNRKIAYNDINMKTILFLYDPIWTTRFNFTIPTYTFETSNNFIELSSLISEGKVQSEAVDFTSKPYCYLRCITPGYSGYADNDTSFEIQNPPGMSLKDQTGYTPPQYLTAIQSAINTKQNWGLSGIVDKLQISTTQNDYPPSIYFNINHIISNTNDNKKQYFEVDFSQSVFSQFNTSYSWKFCDNSDNPIKINPISFGSLYEVNSTNSRIKVTVIDSSYQGINGSYKNFQDPSAFCQYFDISHSSYKFYELLDYVNTKLFSKDSFAKAPYYFVDSMDNSMIIQNINMFGSCFTYIPNNTTSNNDTLLFNLSVRSVLRNQDYQVEFYDPDISGFQQTYYGYGMNDLDVQTLDKNIRNEFDKGNIYVNNYQHVSYFDHAMIVFNAFTSDYKNWTKSVDASWNNTNNSWRNSFKLDHSKYVLKNEKSITTNGNTYTYIQGNTEILDKRIFLTSQNNFFTLIPIDKGVNIPSTQNDIVIQLNLPVNVLYNTDDIVNAINKQFSNYIYVNDPNHKKTPLYGSYINIDEKTHKVTIRLNLNTVFTAEDYALTFFEPSLFTHCSYGYLSSIQTTTWDTTLGWLLGFRNLQKYEMTLYDVATNPSIPDSKLTYYYNKYTNTHYANSFASYDTNTNIFTITGDTSVTVTLYNYFLIVLDDYTQNHLNDGLITVTNPALDIPLPSYASRNLVRCNPTNITSNPNESIYIGNEVDNVTRNSLTTRQLYSANQILNTKQTMTQNKYQNSLGTYIQDIFGIIPVKTAGLTNGQTYIEFGGTLQIQERIYFGPVNIKRMTVRILTDKGTVLDLNNANWSFSLISQQLYNPTKG